MNVHRDPLCLLQLAGESDMVRVGVGQDDRFDVVDRAAHFCQGGLQGVAVSAQAGVDERDLAVLLEQKEMPEFRSQHADHRGPTLSGAGGRRSRPQAGAQRSAPGEIRILPTFGSVGPQMASDPAWLGGFHYFGCGWQGTHLLGRGLSSGFFFFFLWGGGGGGGECCFSRIAQARGVPIRAGVSGPGG